MPGMDGLELQGELNLRECRLPVIIVTGNADVALAVRAMKAGAVDFLEKPYSDDNLMRAVNNAFELVALKGADDPPATAAKARLADLTSREREVLAGLVDGWSNKMIARELGISPRTVEIHRSHLMGKLSCRSLAEAVRLTIDAGFHNRL